MSTTPAQLRQVILGDGVNFIPTGLNDIEIDKGAIIYDIIEVLLATSVSIAHAQFVPAMLSGGFDKSLCRHFLDAGFNHRFDPEIDYSQLATRKRDYQIWVPDVDVFYIKILYYKQF